MSMMGGENARRNQSVFVPGCRPDSVGKYTNLGIAAQEKHFRNGGRRAKNRGGSSRHIISLGNNPY